MIISHTLFWGVFLIALGIAVLLKPILKIKYPIKKFFVAAVLIYLGLNLLFDSHKCCSLKTTKHKIIVKESKIK